MLTEAKLKELIKEALSELGFNSEPVEEMLKETEVAEKLKISEQSLRNDRHLGRGLPYVKINGGRSVRYSASDVNKSLRQHRIGG